MIIQLKIKTIIHRFMVIGKIEGKYWSAIITYREENIRLISVRRSRDDEVKVYES
ncbi:MAG: BrnT family toxin [Xenococcus sp. MO_188.B8]|nr:BrnT family toxin [Xenococcus sp. MO_188.B8]